MGHRNLLSGAPPYAIERAVRLLGANLKTARLRRNLTQEDMASRLGVSRYVVADAENGKLTTGVGVYVGLLWSLGLLDQLAPVADPSNDEEGLALASAEERERSRSPGMISNDF